MDLGIAEIKERIMYMYHTQHSNNAKKALRDLLEWIDKRLDGARISISTASSSSAGVYIMEEETARTFSYADREAMACHIAEQTARGLYLQRADDKLLRAQFRELQTYDLPTVPEPDPGQPSLKNLAKTTTGQIYSNGSPVSGPIIFTPFWDEGAFKTEYEVTPRLS